MRQRVPLTQHVPQKEVALHRYDALLRRQGDSVLRGRPPQQFPLLVEQYPHRAIGGSALTDDIAVPKERADIGEGIPVTYVPARNTIFLSYALALAEVKGASDIFIGVNALDYSGYPDCRPEYIEAFENMARLATKSGVGGAPLAIHTPLSAMRKSDIVLKGLELGVDFSLTHTCYDPVDDGKPCGSCDACILRRKGFEEIGERDPLPYPDM